MELSLRAECAEHLLHRKDTVVSRLGFPVSSTVQFPPLSVLKKDLTPAL